MMKQRSQIALPQVFPGLRATILAIVTILLSLGGSVYCQSAGVSLLLQQIPAQGGTITPGPGTHQFKPNTEITLTATAKPGYQFIGWLGDVSNPNTNSTTAYLNEPKIIIALFERTEYENSLPPTGAPGGGGGSGAGFLQSGVPAGSAGGGSMSGVANNTGLMIGGGGKLKPKAFPAPPSAPWPVDLEKLTLEPPAPLAPVPEDPVVPEPATGILLALGSLFTLVRRSVRRPS